jgi:tetratricopeptide (TPR) repeat protein
MRPRDVKILKLIVATIFALFIGSFTALAQEVNDPVKLEIFNRFAANRGSHPEVAYQIAKEYLEKYQKDNDKHTQYVEKWVSIYKSYDPKKWLYFSINMKNFTEAFRLGAQILEKEPDDLSTQIALADAGYRAGMNKDERYTTEALGYARKAIEAIENGKTPTAWTPFKGKEDTLANLYYTKGFLVLQTNADESIDSLLQATKYESEIRRNPLTYYFLAVAYETGPYKKMADTYKFDGKPDLSKKPAALERVNLLLDRIIDAYARAIATSDKGPWTAQDRDEWMNAMTAYYKYRHNGSDKGKAEFIANVLQSPLPSKP